MRRSILKPSSLLELSTQVASSSPAALSHAPPSAATRDKREVMIKIRKRLRFQLKALSPFVSLAALLVNLRVKPGVFIDYAYIKTMGTGPEIGGPDR